MSNATTLDTPSVTPSTLDREQLRPQLIELARLRTLVSIENIWRGLACVTVGRIVSLTATHVVVVSSRSSPHETPLPLSSITRIDRLGASARGKAAT